VSRGQIFLVSAISAVILTVIFTSIALQISEVEVSRTGGLKLSKKGLTAIRALIRAGAIDSIVGQSDSSLARYLLTIMLPPNTYYKLTVEWNGEVAIVSNKDVFEPQATIRYVYSSLSLKLIVKLKLELSLGG